METRSAARSTTVVDSFLQKIKELNYTEGEEQVLQTVEGKWEYAGLQVYFLDYLHGGREEAEELGYDSDPKGGDEDDEEEAVSRDDTLSKYSLEQMEKIVHAYFVDKVPWKRLSEKR